ncbi:MAG: PIN domain-containing protein [Archangium sp.]|nr:PIN domain-containing protein [Archangium sp.]MDP3155976.1 PIN domain-containing protein [Archangium sp.]MDP3576128.1 PIN domain-containing protein [Archangium sp.]
MIIADTGFFLALANRADRDNEAAVSALGKLREGLVTTWPVVTETAHLLANRLGTHALLTWVASARGGAFEIFELTSAHWLRLEALMRHYAELPMDLADASLVLLAEEQNDGRILSTDRRDFRTYRWKKRKPFKNLLDLDG